MSIFGKLDAAKIPTNPFFVEQGEYSAEVTSASVKYSNKKQINQLIIEYTINDQTSEYFNSRVVQYFDLVDPTLTEEDIELLPVEDKKALKRNISSLKRTLCGTGNGRPGLGIKDDDLNDPGWDPEILVGLQVSIGIQNYGPNNDSVTVRWVNLSSGE